MLRKGCDAVQNVEVGAAVSRLDRNRQAITGFRLRRARLDGDDATRRRSGDRFRRGGAAGQQFEIQPRRQHDRSTALGGFRNGLGRRNPDRIDRLAAVVHGGLAVRRRHDVEPRVETVSAGSAA